MELARRTGLELRDAAEKVHGTHRVHQAVPTGEDLAPVESHKWESSFLSTRWSA